MTISSTTAKNTYNGNGVTTAFPYSFRILDDDHLLVQTKVISTGVVTDLVKTTDYTVSGVDEAAGGNVTLVDAATDAPTGNQIIITRNVPILQETDYQEYDPFSAASHEEALDKLTMIAQQISEQSDRTIKMDAGVDTDDVSTTLPGPSASAVLAWNADADAIENVTITDLVDSYTIPVGTGFLAQTSALTATLRTLTGTANEITVTNGGGTGGNPTLSLPTTLTFTGKTVTGGTFASPAITTAILDSSGNELFKFTATASAINEFTNTNAAIGTNPQLSATGGDTNIGLDFLSKGTGAYRFLGTATAPGTIQLFEQTSNGTNKVSILAAASIASDLTVTLKSASSGYPVLDSTDGDAWTSFTPGFTGFSADPSGVVAAYKKIGKTCFIRISMSNGTSNATGFTITTLPFTSAATAQYFPASFATDNGTQTTGKGVIINSGTTVLILTDSAGSATGWTNSGTKGALISLAYETA